jgi:hypothetical protein
MTYHGRADADPLVLARLEALLRGEWDPYAELRDAALADDAFYREHALAVAAMLAADARDTEVQRYLRMTEQALLGRSLHPYDARRAVAVTAWHLARGLEPPPPDA